MSYVLRAFDLDAHRELVGLWRPEALSALRARLLEEVARRPAAPVRGAVDTSTERGWWQSARTTFEAFARIPSLPFDGDPGWSDLEGMVVGALCTRGIRPLVSLEVLRDGEWTDIEHDRFRVRERFELHRSVHDCELGRALDGAWRFPAHVRTLPLGDASTGLLGGVDELSRVIERSRSLKPSLGVGMWLVDGPLLETVVSVAHAAMRRGGRCALLAQAVIRALDSSEQWVIARDLDVVPAV